MKINSKGFIGCLFALSFVFCVLSIAEMETREGSETEAAEEGAELEPTGEKITVDTVMAIVNGKAITMGDVAKIADEILESYKDKAPSMEWEKFKREVYGVTLKRLIERELIIDEAKRLKYDEEETRVITEINAIAELKNEYKGDLEQYLAKKKLTYNNLFDKMKEDLLYRKFIQTQIMPKVYVSPSDIREFYDTNKEMYEEKEKVHCFAIVFYKKGNPDEDNEIFLNAKQILEQIKEGADFSDMAKKYSEHSGSRDKGGDWGWVSRDEIVSNEVTEMLFNLKVGELSDVVEGEFAYWILLSKGKKEASTKTLREVWDKIERKIFSEKLQNEMDKYVIKLWRKSAIVLPAVSQELF